MVARDSSMAVTTPASDPEINVMSAASIATSVPVPIASPTSAAARAGASLIPSPTMPTLRPSPRSRRISSALSPGSTSATTWPTPTWAAIARAVRALSPVSMTTSMPRRRNAAMTRAESSFTVSATASTPAGTPSTAASTGVLPWADRSAATGSSPLALMPASSSSRELPTKIACPSALA